MRKLLLICCAALCLMLSACGFMGRRQRPEPVVTPTPTPVVEQTRRPTTPTDLRTETSSPTDLTPAPTENAGDALLKENQQEIPFNYVFRGFFLTTPEKLSKIISGPDSSVLIQDEEGWQDYQAKYCPGIEWSGEYYYPEYQYFAMITTGAKPKYAVSLNVDRVTFSESEIEVSTKLEPIEAQIQAYSDLDGGAGEGHAQYFVCIIALKSSNIPEAVAENMKYVY